MIIYSKFNNSRKPEFQLLTTIEKEGENIFSYKKSLSKKADDFLNSMIKNYEKMIEVSFSIIPAKPEKLENKIKFEYKNGETFERMLFKSFEKKDKEKFLSIIKKFVYLLEKNKIVEDFTSDDFNKIFENDSEKNRKKQKLIEIGCLDINFDNIVKDTKNDDIFLIDYEWFFDFPLPIKYITFRSITSFYIKNSSYNLIKFIDIEELYEVLNISKKDRDIFIRYEYNFQKYVNEKIGCSFNDFCCNFTYPKENQTNKQKTEIKNHELYEEIKAIKSSKTWKILNFYLKIKNYLMSVFFSKIIK